MGTAFATNPAIAAFNDGMAQAAKRRQEDVDLDASKQRLDENRQSQPFRVSRLESDSRIGRTAAEVAEATKGANIRVSYNTADAGDIRNADNRIDLAEKGATSGSRVGATNATNEATRTTAPVKASYEVNATPFRLQQEKDAATRSGVQAQDSQLKFFKDVVELIDQGKIGEAEELARRTGETIPDRVRNDAGLRRTMKEAVADAERFYPNRPRAQQQHVKTIMDEVLKRGPANITPVAPRLEALPGLPAASESGTNKNQTAMMQNIDDLVRRGIAKDDKDAFRLLQSSRSNSTETLNKLIADETKLRIEEAKAKGAGYGSYDVNQIQKEAERTALEKFNRIRAYASKLDDTAPPPGAVSAIVNAPPAETPAPTSAPAPAPAAPAEQPKPGLWERWTSGWGSSKPATNPQGQTLSPSGVPDARQFQGAPPKEQGRLPPTGAAPIPPSANAPAQPSANAPVPLAAPRDDQRALAQRVDPQAVREFVRREIASGKPREPMLERLKQLGIDSTGL